MLQACCLLVVATMIIVHALRLIYGREPTHLQPDSELRFRVTDLLISH